MVGTRTTAYISKWEKYIHTHLPKENEIRAVTETGWSILTLFLSILSLQHHERNINVTLPDSRQKKGRRKIFLW